READTTPIVPGGSGLNDRLGLPCDAAPPGPTQLARRLVPHQRELGEPYARRRDPHLRGAAADLRGPAGARHLAPTPGAAVQAEAVLPAGADRAPVLDRRSQLQPGVPRPALRASGAGLRGAAAAHGRPRLLPAARPHE